jgi:hypothetical protein
MFTAGRWQNAKTLSRLYRPQATAPSKWIISPVHFLQEFYWFSTTFSTQNGLWSGVMEFHIGLKYP